MTWDERESIPRESGEGESAHQVAFERLVVGQLEASEDLVARLVRLGRDRLRLASREHLDSQFLNLVQHHLASAGVKLAVERVVLADQDVDVGNGRKIVDCLCGFEAEQLRDAFISGEEAGGEQQDALHLQQQKRE